MSNKKFHLTLLTIGIAVLLWSGWKPHDYFTWILEVFPAIIAAVMLVAIYRRFRFSNLVYVLILAHAIILMIGGTRSSKVPFATLELRLTTP